MKFDCVPAKFAFYPLKNMFCTLLEKKGVKRVLRCPVFGTLALEPAKGVPENPRTLWGTFKGSIVCTGNL